MHGFSEQYHWVMFMCKVTSFLNLEVHGGSVHRNSDGFFSPLTYCSPNGLSERLHTQSNGLGVAIPALASQVLPHKPWSRLGIH